MELVLAYAAGLLTLVNPCVLPVLPVVLASAMQADRRGPLALTAGMSVAFVALGLGVAAAGRSVGLDPVVVADAGAVLMLGFGLVLLVPQVSAGFATATAGVASRADARIGALDGTGLRGQFVAGTLLGAVWGPCVGPTLGGAIALASQGESLVWAGAIMTVFALGVSTVMLALGYGARSVVRQRQAWMRAVALRARPILGGVFVAMGLALLLGLHQAAEVWILDHMPPWLIAFSVSL